MDSSPAQFTPPRPTIFVLAALLLALVVGWVYSSKVDESRSFGWDESMHAALPAKRIALEIKAGNMHKVADVLHGCMQYPFMWPLVVGVLHAQFDTQPMSAEAAPRPTTGIEARGRALGRWNLALLLLGLTFLARECWRGPRSPWGLFMAPLLVLASPLMIDYSGTWFLEVPFATATTFALWAWVSRARVLFARITEAERRPSLWWRDTLTGTLIAAAFFTKFNYGLLLGLGLFLDLAWDFVSVLRGRGPSVRTFLIATLRLTIVPLLAFAWWFLWPLPFGADIAAAHREALLAFLRGNLELVRTPDSLRLLHWMTSFVATPRLFLLVVLGLSMSLVFMFRQLRSGCNNGRSQRRLWIVLIAMAVPIVGHNFHLDRFLIVLAPAVMPLVAAGWSALTAALLGRRFGFESKLAYWAPFALLPGLVLAGLVSPAWDGHPAFKYTAGFREKPDVRAYQERLLIERQSIGPSRRLSTAGLDRTAADHLVALIAKSLSTSEAGQSGFKRFAWLGISSELSPAALHIGVYDSTGKAERLLQDSAASRPDGTPQMIVTFEGLDPGWNDDQLQAWAASFDVIFTSVPPDLRGRASRDFIKGYQQRLIGSGKVSTEELGTVPVPQPLGPPKLVRLFALTPLDR